MTRQEALEPFSLLAANWSFLDFSNDSVFEVWFGTLERYPVAEVREGIRDLVANEKSTPTVALAREYVDKVRSANRRREQEHNLNLLWSNAVRCTKCRDFGYTVRVYPTGYEYVVPCDCEVAKMKFTPKWRTGPEAPMSKEKMVLLFGKESDQGFKLVRYVPEDKNKEIVWRYEKSE